MTSAMASRDVTFDLTPWNVRPELRSSRKPIGIVPERPDTPDAVLVTVFVTVFVVAPPDTVVVDVELSPSEGARA